MAELGDGRVVLELRGGRVVAGVPWRRGRGKAGWGAWKIEGEEVRSRVRGIGFPGYMTLRDFLQI